MTIIAIVHGIKNHSQENLPQGLLDVYGRDTEFLDERKMAIVPKTVP